MGHWDSAALVRGEDRFGHFALSPRPSRDFDPKAVKFHEKAATAVREVLFKVSEKCMKCNARRKGAADNLIRSAETGEIFGLGTCSLLRVRAAFQQPGGLSTFHIARIYREGGK